MSRVVVFLTCCFLIFACSRAMTAEKSKSPPSPEPDTATAYGAMPLLVEEDFEKGAERWQPTDPKAWRVADVDGGKVFEQYRASKYNPPYRSPLNIALLKDVTVGDFVLTAKVKSTTRDYGHRDVCLFFGYQDPAHFYYSHLGKKADPASNQIMIVNSAARKKITEKGADGTNWTDHWHQVKVVRKVSDGTIEIYFDDMKTPHQVAKDKTFSWGQVGVGTFDDTAMWDDVKLYGVKVTKK